MKVCSSWAVAVVFLLEKDDGVASVEEITKYIISTDLTTLGEEGPTPEKTVRSILGRQKNTKGLHQVFCCEDDDCYSLWFPEEIKEHEKVKLVYEMLERKKVK